MSLTLIKPSYPCEPIRNISALGRALDIAESHLIELSHQADGMYSVVPPKPGSNREIFNAKPALKMVHKRLKDAILLRVLFPSYLTGSIRGRDYITNASLHVNKKILICEDVKSFFPSVLAHRVHDIWKFFFGFSEEVAALLTKLTTKDGKLPQGAIPSSYLANLVLWREEPLLQAKLAAIGVTYSRYVDDMALSAIRYLNKFEQSKIISAVYGMLRRNGLSASRKKHQTFDSSQRMIVTKLGVNVKPSLPPKKRANIRTEVYQVEKRFIGGDFSLSSWDALKASSHKVGQLKRLHPTQASALQLRLHKIRESYSAFHPVFTTTSKGFNEAEILSGSDDTAPW